MLKNIDLFSDENNIIGLIYSENKSIYSND